MKNVVRRAVWVVIGGGIHAVVQGDVAAVTGPGWDRSRGTVEISPEQAVYEAGGHFGRWTWPDPRAIRPGRYHAEVSYATALPRIGFQVAVGEEQAKGYAPGTGGLERRHKVRLSMIHLGGAKDYPLKMLSSVDVADVAFELEGISLAPAPEGAEPIVREDGTIELPAGAATTLSETMRYDAGKAGGSLTGWNEIEDWAEWTFETETGGTFTVDVVYHCDENDGGSEVSLWADDSELSFAVNGSDERWTTASVGKVMLEEGPARWLAIKPRSKAGEEVFELRTVILKPVTDSNK